MDKSIKELAVELTVEITYTCENIKGKSIFINQLLRACSSIGANSYEAKYAQSTADFVNKLEIALKECNESEYWLELLYDVGNLSKEEANKIRKDCIELRRMLVSSVTTLKSKL